MPVGPEHRSLTIANAVLDRYGIATRDIVLAEGIPGGFTGLYPALAGLEDVGTVRRGYFIEGMGGAQFALPGAVERLRRSTDGTTVLLAAADPANPYGASLPWPDTDGRPDRRAGATIVLLDGRPLAWLDPAGKRIATFSEDPATVAAIVDLAHRHAKASIATIDGAPAREHPISGDLLAAGFMSGYKGYTVRSAPRHGTPS